MIKYKRRWMIAAVILIIAGLALFAGAMAANQWDFEVLSLHW